MRKLSFLVVGLSLACSLVAAAQDADVSIIADQVRSQGFACENPSSAERLADESLPDQNVYKLTCEGATYRVHLIPDMAAEITKLE